ncbi:MAG: DUF6285 domain-containing protein [Dehalococcoidia bacterium]|nr:DUF6285 domain-containing protein [Dehalococcoidia bacterium]
MQDRPTYDELLAAVESFLDEEIVPNSEGARRFHARVSANVLRIVRRELEHADEQFEREWAGLVALLGPAERPAGRSALREARAARTGELCARVRAGDADAGPFRNAVLAHARHTVRDKLVVTNPGWLRERTS